MMDCSLAQHPHSRNHRRERLVCLALLMMTVPLLVWLPACAFLADLFHVQPAEVTTVGVQLVASGFVAPLALEVPPDLSGRKFIVDQAGVIYVLDASGTLRAEPFLDLRDRMVQLNPSYDERGLLGLAFHPQYGLNGRFFVFYTAPKEAGDPVDFDSRTHISEFHVAAGDANAADPASEVILLDFLKPQSNHNGGQLRFGPDGFLYASTGDGGAANDVGVGHTLNTGNAQDLTRLLGKILRIDVNHGSPYTVPADNPFVDNGGAQPEIWAYGLRNPFRFSFDSGGSHQLFCADVGQNLFEEVDLITKGGNYGWNLREGLHCFAPDSPNTPPPTCPSVGGSGEPLIDPILEYPHLDPSGGPMGIAAIGGFIYRGTAMSSLTGQYVFGDLSRGFLAGDGSLFAATKSLDGSWSMRELAVAAMPGARLGRFIHGFGEDASGELYVLATTNLGPTGTTGEVYKIVPAPANP